MHSFYWLDYETVGANPATDWPAQFAGIRTDTDFNEIGTPLNIYCKLPADHLPHPEAALVTGLDPYTVNERGLIEPEFIRKIHHELSQANTCAVGYNSIRFDDEVTRHSLYRNFYDPYAREWQNGNSRWDIIDLVRLTAVLRPDGIQWPLREDGHKSFRLEELTQANGLEHGDAHDALSDVRATIALAKLIKQKQPNLYNYVFKNRGKAAAAAHLNLLNKKAVVHISGMFGADKGCLGVVMPLAEHPDFSGKIIVYDLLTDPEPLVSLSADEIKSILFTPIANLPPGTARIPLKVIHLNKCPVIAPLGVLKPDNCEKLNINLKDIEQRQNYLFHQPGLDKKVQQVFNKSEQTANTEKDPDLMLYSEGFFSRMDRDSMNRLIRTPADQITSSGFSFQDPRLDEMLFRYRGRHYPQTLSPEERAEWRKFCQTKLAQTDSRHLNFSSFMKALNIAKLKTDTTPKKDLLEKLESFARDSATQLGLMLPNNV